MVEDLQGPGHRLEVLVWTKLSVETCLSHIHLLEPHHPIFQGRRFRSEEPETLNPSPQSNTVHDINPASPSNKEYALPPHSLGVLKIMQGLYHQQ